MIIVVSTRKDQDLERAALLQYARLERAIEEASGVYDAFAHDDGWEGPSAPVVSALSLDEFRGAVNNLAAQRPTPPGDGEAASIVVRQALGLSEGSVSYEVIHSN